MASPLDKQVDMHIEESALEKGIVTPSPSSSEKEGSPLKYNEKGVALVPQPSDDPRDPLNWPARKKVLLTLAVGASSVSGYAAQAAVYGETPVRMTYGIAAATAGLVVGPYFLYPLTLRYGKCWMTFWGTVLCMVTNIWSAVMTNHDDYNTFIVSRLFAGLTGSCVSFLGPEFFVEIFFLHDRGKVFGIYFSCIMLGIGMAPTFSGYITYYTSWTIQFWYQVAFLGASALATLLFVEETGWNRGDSLGWPLPPEGWLAKRFLLYFNPRGFKVTPYLSTKRERWSIGKPLRIFVSPVVLLGGFVVMVTLGWVLSLQTFITIYLMTPTFAGGYGFDARQVANFTFCNWVGILLSQVYAFLAYDRIPLFVCKRFYKGVWHPELRLHSIWPILIIYPIALGLFGEGLKQQWNYMALAVFCATAQFSGAAVLPVMSNYMIEAAGRHLAKEVNMAVSADRLILGTAAIVFLSPWGDAVGPRWVFGTMAFIEVFAGGIVLLLVLFGHRIRQWNLVVSTHSEEGAVLENDESQ